MAGTKLTVVQIVAKKKVLENRDSGRNQSYDEVLQFYGGDTLKNYKKKNYVPGVTQALSSIFSAPANDEITELTTPINLVKPAIENKVAFLALQPTVRVIEPPDQLAPQQQMPSELPGAGAPMQGSPVGGMQPPAPTPQEAPAPGAPPVPAAPGPTNDDWGTDLADRLEKVIKTLLDASNMPQRCRDVAWSMCAMDGAVIGSWPDLRHGRPRIFTRTPQDFYPESYDPDGLELSFALWVDTVSGDSIVARYGPQFANSYAGRDEVEIIQCIDESFFYTVIDSKEFAHDPMENKMGVVPIVCVGNLGLPGMIFGSTEIKDAIPVAKEINYHMALVDEMAASLVRPTLAVKDPLSVPDEFGIGRGGTITMGKDGSVELLGPLSLPNAFWQLGAQLQAWYDIVADNPSVLRADDGGGLTTGKGFNARLGPIAARMQTRLEILMSAWRQAIKYMLMMWANFPGMKPVKASGVKMKESFYIKAEPQEFTVDGEIWTEIDVFIDAQSYIDRQGTDVEIMQLYQNELISWDEAVENLRFVTNKRRTRQRIDKDRQWKAQGMAIAQGAAQSPMTANPELGAQMKTNYGLERGFMGETGPMPGPEGGAAGGPPQTSPEMPLGAPSAPSGGGEGLVPVLRDFFSSIAKLRGSVWFGGDPIKRVEKLSGDNWTVDVWITDPQDQGTITNAARNVEVVYGHIRFHRGQPDPSEGAIQVAQGAAPVAGPPEELPPEANPTEGMNPDILSMIGGGE